MDALKVIPYRCVTGEVRHGPQPDNSFRAYCLRISLVFGPRTLHNTLLLYLHYAIFIANHSTRWRGLWNMLQPAVRTDFGVYEPRNPRASHYYRCVEAHFDKLEAVWDDRYAGL